MSEERANFPHCDELVLHAPEECTVCDEFKDLQNVRINNGIPFSGQGDSPDEARRPREVIDRWGGNRPKPHKGRVVKPELPGGGVVGPYASFDAPFSAEMLKPRCVRCGATKEYVRNSRGTDLGKCLPVSGTHFWPPKGHAADTAHHAWHWNGQYPTTCGPCADWPRCRHCGTTKPEMVNCLSHKLEPGRAHPERKRETNETISTYMKREQELASRLPTCYDMLARLLCILADDSCSDDSVGLGVRCLRGSCDKPVVFDFYCDEHLPPKVRALWPYRSRIDVSVTAAKEMHESNPRLMSNDGTCAAIWCIVHHPEKTDPALDRDAAKRYHRIRDDQGSECLLKKCALHQPYHECVTCKEPGDFGGSGNCANCLRNFGPGHSIEAARFHHEAHGDMDGRVCMLNACALHYPKGHASCSGRERHHDGSNENARVQAARALERLEEEHG